MRPLTIGLLMLSLLLVACNRSPTVAPTLPGRIAPTQPATAAVLPSAAAIPSATPEPSPTPVPLAATVNDQPITLADYEAALAQYQEWYGDRGPNNRDIRAYTLDTLIEQELLNQAADRMGITVAQETVAAAISEAILETGGPEAYAVWLDESGFSEETFRARVTDELRIQAVVEAVTADVPTTAEFVRARYIQVADADTAAQVQAELAAGADFATLVDLYSIEPGKAASQGDLGFFMRGMLTVPAVEETAFALQPREISDTLVVTGADGTVTYYIVQTVAREPFRALGAEQRAELLAQAFTEWLAAERAAATIEPHIGFD